MAVYEGEGEDLLLLTCDFVHHQRGHIFVVNVEDQVWSALVNLLRQVVIHYVGEGVISCAHIMLID